MRLASLSILFAVLAVAPYEASAARCVVISSQTVQFSDYCTPCSSDHPFYQRCLLEVQPDSATAWRVLFGGSSEIVLLEDNEVRSILPVRTSSRYSGYVISPNISSEYVLLGYMSGWSGPESMELHSFEDHSSCDVIEDRPVGRAGDAVSSFICLLAGSSVYFVDAAAYFGGYSSETADVEFDYTGSGDSYHGSMFPLYPLTYSAARDGSLFVAGMQESCYEGRTHDEVVGFSLKRGILWTTECRSYAGIGVSDNGEIVAVDKFRDGVLLLNGQTGEVLQTYLHDCLIRPGDFCSVQNRNLLCLSPNGRYLGTTFTASDSSDYTAGMEYLICIDTSDSVDGRFCWSIADMALHSPKVMAIANNGAMLVLDEEAYGSARYLLIDRSGRIQWEVFTSRFSDVADLAYTGNGYLIGYADTENGVATFIELAIRRAAVR